MPPGGQPATKPYSSGILRPPLWHSRFLHCDQTSHRSRALPSYRALSAASLVQASPLSAWASSGTTRSASGWAGISVLHPSEACQRPRSWARHWVCRPPKSIDSSQLIRIVSPWGPYKPCQERTRPRKAFLGRKQRVPIYLIAIASAASVAGRNHAKSLRKLTATAATRRPVRKPMEDGC